MLDRIPGEHRIIIVSNRLPFTLKRDKELGTLLLEDSAGGLVSGLSAWLETLGKKVPSAYTWVGWPGATVSADERDGLEAAISEQYNAHPVYLSNSEMERFYQGFCNTTIWPLFHYFPSYAMCRKEQWLTYRQVNRAFCEAVMQIYRPGDIIWVHDYHLMLLPGLLREQLPGAPIGFFLHIPFPSYEILRILPGEWRDEILSGLLGADLLGFHSTDYTDHFLSSVRRFLGYEHSAEVVKGSARHTRARAFPMGIDYARYAQAASAQTVQQREGLKSMLGDARVILSIDRLDYTKGIPNRLRGYAAFLEQYPEWQGKVVMALVVTPSRVGVQHYQETREQIERLAGNINGRFGRFNWVPIVYQYRYVPLADLAALYSVSDVALVTPLRDGMNLISKEYLACRTDGTGVLVLSVLAGAAEELREAVLINPNSQEEIVEGLREALRMPAKEQVRRNRAMQRRLSNLDVVPWAHQFVRELVQMNSAQPAGTAHEYHALQSESVIAPASSPEDTYSSSHKKLVIHRERLF
jgi:trehalose 6-phosphate synthase/phosphatase